MKKTSLGRILFFAVASVLSFAILALAICGSSPATAEDFANAVKSLKNADSLAAAEAALGEANDVLASYKSGGGSETDTDVAESYAYYVTAKADIEQRIDNCNRFVAAVAAALEENAPYVTVDENLKIAKELHALIINDMAYGNVALYDDLRRNLMGELDQPVESCTKHVEYAARAAAATTWKEANQYLKLAESAVIEIPDFPGLDEAAENIRKAKEFMSNQVIAAKPFCDAVRDISKAESIPLGIAHAYEMLKSVDATAENAAKSLNNLKSIEKSYNRSVKDANEAANEAALLAFSILF